MCSIKMMFIKLLNCVRVFILIKMHKDCEEQGFFAVLCKAFNNKYFVEPLRTAAFVGVFFL